MVVPLASKSAFPLAKIESFLLLSGRRNAPAVTRGYFNTRLQLPRVGGITGVSSFCHRSNSDISRSNLWKSFFLETYVIDTCACSDFYLMGLIIATFSSVLSDIFVNLSA